MRDPFVELFSQGYEASQAAFNAEDYDRALAGLAPDVEYHPLASLLETGILRGRDEVAGFFKALREANDWTTETREYIPAGDMQIIVRIRGTTVGRTTRIANTIEFYELVEVGDDGRVTRMRDYERREDALAAAAGNR